MRISCKNCFALREFILRTRLFSQRKPLISPIVRCLYTTSSEKRSETEYQAYVKWKLASRFPLCRTLADDVDALPRYFRGKMLVEETEDPLIYKNMLLMMNGYDEAVLDNYFQFIHKAAKMTEVDLTKSFNMPAVKEKISATDISKDETHEYALKKFQRVIEVSDVTSDKVDIFIEYIQEKLPEGIRLNIELKRWEELVAPDHPSLKKEEVVGHTGQ